MNRIDHGANSAQREGKKHVDNLLDDALADTFPASDPVSNLVADTPVRIHASPGSDEAPSQKSRS
jgi:hypothetical protein